MLLAQMERLLPLQVEDGTVKLVESTRKELASYFKRGITDKGIVSDVQYSVQNGKIIAYG